jgi:AraC-like DNA-binding protein
MTDKYDPELCGITHDERAETLHRHEAIKSYYDAGVALGGPVDRFNEWIQHLADTRGIRYQTLATILGISEAATWRLFKRATTNSPKVSPAGNQKNTKTY